MNDDFLRRLRRPPSAPFERQLRARLREQELNETSRRRPRWKVLVIAMLVGGSALATATYLTMMTRAPSPSLPSAQQTQTDSTSSQAPGSRLQAAPLMSRWLYQHDAQTSIRESRAPSVPAEGASASSVASASARDNKQTPNDASVANNKETNGYISSTGPQTSAANRPIRIITTPDIAMLVKDMSPESRYTPSASFEFESVNEALLTLCAENVADQPDVIVTSRRARRAEFKLCRKRLNGEVLEATLGHIAIVVTSAKSAAPMSLSMSTLRLALLKQVPAPDNRSQLIDNPYTHWNQIDPALEERRIEVLGPARGTPEFLVFAAIVLAPACEDNASLDKEICQSVREDGVYEGARWDANFVPQRLWSNPNAVAIMDYRFYAANSADLLGSLLSGPAPTRESIIDGNYAGARTLHAYVNNERYGHFPRVRLLVDEYLRLPANLHPGVILPPDGSLEGRRWNDGGPKLTAVKLD